MMLAILFLLLVTVPLAELWLIVRIADEIGFWWTIALMLFLSVAGAWLLKQQGRAAWARLLATLRRGEVPTSEVTDGALILLGGALLLTPGFLTDVAGLALLLPPTRAGVKGAARKLLARLAIRRAGSWGARGVRLYDGRVTRVRRGDVSAPGSSPSPGASPDRLSPRGDGEDDAPLER